MSTISVVQTEYSVGRPGEVASSGRQSGESAGRPRRQRPFHPWRLRVENLDPAVRQALVEHVDGGDMARELERVSGLTPEEQEHWVREVAARWCSEPGRLPPALPAGSRGAVRGLPAPVGGAPGLPP
ncbi:MAG: hypothetical protein AB1758_09915 [Candidatus Eremiobacterota bacterium]